VGPRTVLNLSMQGIEPRFLGRTIRDQISILTELPSGASIIICVPAAVPPGDGGF
jgi:hypothetical protein